jgi:outer membrane biosynthesis protein TonB
MATSRPFAYNTGASISGTTQFGSLIVGDINADYGSDYGGVKWWGGPNEDLRYVIGNARPGGQPVPSGATGTAQVGFWGTPLGDKTDSAFLDLANYVGSLSSQPPFATTNDAVTWLNANGYYTSYTTITPTPTGTIAVTPTNTPTGTAAETPTPTPTETEVLTPTPTETEVLTPTPTETEVLTPTPTETEVLTPTPTETETPTPTPTETEVLTPTPTETETPTPTPTETEVLTPTPTPTPTETPTNTPSITLTGETPTPTPTPTSTDLSSITTYSISGCTNLNVLVVDLGPGLIVLGDVNYYTFTGATPSGCYSVISKINAPIDDAFTTSFGTGGCNDCESTYITPTPTPTNTETPTNTPTVTPTSTQLYFLLFEDGSIATAENNDNIEIDII